MGGTLPGQTGDRPASPGREHVAPNHGRGPAASGLRHPEPRDHDAMLALNNAHASELSLLDGSALADLLGAAWLAVMADDASAMLLAFDQDADYGSPNYAWFKERLRRFVYVDRVVVAPAMRGAGLARAMYAELVARASAEGHSVICCEVNLEPPNPVSARFHAAIGFREAGKAFLPDRGKTVSYLVREIGAPQVATGKTGSPAR